MILTKYIGIATFVGGFIAGGGAMKFAQPKIEFPPPVECPSCVCPPQANSIDFDKVKNFKGTLRIEQHYELSSDSAVNVVLQKAVSEAIQAELSKLKIAKCK